MKIDNTKVVDATKRVTVTILPRDVAKGDKKDPAACAAAVAAIRQFKATAARVEGDDISPATCTHAED